MRNLVKLVPEDKLLFETDSPLMLPRDKKGEPVLGTERPIILRNEPMNVRMLASLQSELRKTTLEKLGKETSINVNSLFGII